MLTFIKKDLLIFWRSRWDVAIILLLPVLLVIVLNFVFAGLFDSDEMPYDLSLAIVHEDDEQVGIQKFTDQVNAMDLSESDAQALIKQAHQNAPVAQLLGFLHNPEMAEWLSVEQLDKETAMQKVEQEELDGMVTIPKGYTFQALQTILLNEENTAELPFQVKENSTEVDVMTNILGSYFETANLQLALQHIADAEPTMSGLPQGGHERMEGANPFTMAQYFTIAMAALFSLFVATTVAERTGEEKRELVMNRIQLANTRPIAFLMGKTFSTFCLSWLQITFVVLVSHFILGVFSGKSALFWCGLFLVMTMYAITIAGMSALFTSILLRIKSVNGANGMFMPVTMILGILGGNFVPIYVLPGWLQQIGEWTPNGMSLAVLTEWILFENASLLWFPVLWLGIITGMTFFAGVALFSKRGVA